MLDNLTYRKKNRLLIVVAIVLLFVIYNFAIKRTILAYKDFAAAKEQVIVAANAPLMAAQLEKELAQMDAKISNQNINGLNTEQALIELITNYCQSNHAVLREFPQTTVADQGKLLVETNLFVVEGDFSTLINLAYILEQKSKLGKVASVHYQLKKDLKSKEMVLTATIYLQNVIKKKNEK